MHASMNTILMIGNLISQGKTLEQAAKSANIPVSCITELIDTGALDLAKIGQIQPTEEETKIDIGTVKYSPNLIHYVCQLLSKGNTIEEVYKITGVVSSTISAIRSGRTRRDISSQYVFPESRVSMVVRANTTKTWTQNLYYDIFSRFPEYDITDADMHILDEILMTEISRSDHRAGTVLRLRCGFTGISMTLDDIGKQFNITGTRVRQIQVKGLQKLRHPNVIARIKPLFQSRQDLGGIIHTQEHEIKNLRQEVSTLNSRVEELESKLHVESTKENPNLPIEELEFSVRAYNCLYRAKLLTTSDIVEAIESGEILKCRNLGKKSFQEVLDTMKRLRYIK